MINCIFSKSGGGGRGRGGGGRGERNRREIDSTRRLYCNILITFVVVRKIIVKACTINSYELRYFLSFFLFFFFLKYNANIPLLSVQIMEDVRSEYKCFSAREVRATLLLVSFAKVQPRIY